MSPQEGSPHSDDVCTDKNLLLTHWLSGQTAITIIRTVAHPAEECEDKSVSCENISRDKRRGICSVLELGLGEEVEDGTGDGESMEKHKRRGICSLEPEMEVELAAHLEGRQKRCGICSPDLVGLDLSNKDVEDLDNKEHGICSAVELTEQATHSDNSVKHPDDETPSDVLSVPSEVLSAHDYENMCADRPLAEFFAEDHDPSMFVAQPYVVDQHGALFPLTTLDTIVEELEESSTSTESSETMRHKQCHDSASTLVAPINEICHAHARAEFELSPSSEDNISTKPSPEVILDASPYLESVQNMDSHCPTNDIMPKIDDSVPRKKQAANRPCRKFYLLHEKFEAKQTEANIEVDPKPPETPQFCVDCPAVSRDDSRLSVPCESERESIVCFNKENVTPVVPKRIKQWNNYLKAQNSCNSR
ncbi:hypothetical protein Cfor_11379 [Coptotermes formosanus]|uniref:Uncharacterized protein n=1 Tax=Coptotermes formosanus TaxID=36987 RepID=A0A6L2PLS2_COPFO|nr:hypothetical protein Cfor_11379 [Coptotermes formosanus]